LKTTKAKTYSDPVHSL